MSPGQPGWAALVHPGRAGAGGDTGVCSGNGNVAGWLGCTPDTWAFAVCACWRGSCGLRRRRAVGGWLGWPRHTRIGGQLGFNLVAGVGVAGAYPSCVRPCGVGVTPGTHVGGVEFYPACVRGWGCGIHAGHACPWGRRGLSRRGGCECAVPEPPGGTRRARAGALPSTAPAPAAAFPSGFDPNSEQKGQPGGRRAPPPRRSCCRPGRRRHLAAPPGAAAGAGAAPGLGRGGAPGVLRGKPSALLRRVRKCVLCAVLQCLQ